MYLLYPSTGLNIVCAGPNFGQTQKCQIHETIVPIPNFLARPNDDMHLENSVLLPTQKKLECHKMKFNFWSGPKHFGKDKAFDCFKLLYQSCF